MVNFQQKISLWLISNVSVRFILSQNYFFGLATYWLGSTGRFPWGATSRKCAPTSPDRIWERPWSRAMYIAMQILCLVRSNAGCQWIIENSVKFKRLNSRRYCPEENNTTNDEQHLIFRNFLDETVRERSVDGKRIRKTEKVDYLEIAKNSHIKSMNMQTKAFCATVQRLACHFVENSKMCWKTKRHARVGQTTSLRARISHSISHTHAQMY